MWKEDSWNTYFSLNSTGLKGKKDMLRSKFGLSRPGAKHNRRPFAPSIKGSTTPHPMFFKRKRKKELIERRWEKEFLQWGKFHGTRKGMFASTFFKLPFNKVSFIVFSMCYGRILILLVTLEELEFWKVLYGCLTLWTSGRPGNIRIVWKLIISHNLIVEDHDHEAEQTVPKN